MYIVYNILYFLVLIVILPFELWRRPQPVRGRWLKERLGYVPQMPDGKEAVWVHAVSVGEVIASIPLVKKLKTEYPGRTIVISTVTDTGQKVAKERAGDIADIIYIPFDLTFAVANAFSRVRPLLFIIMETELWPAMIRFARKVSVPVLLMNGRLSEKSVRGYRKLSFFFGSVVKDVSYFCMQDDMYAERIISLGAEPSNVIATGNFKFDTTPPAPVPAWVGTLKGPVLIAGSTHRPEEEIVLDLFTRLASEMPDICLIVAPRHPERFAEVEEIVRKRGLRYLKRSEIKSTEGREKTKADIKDSSASDLTDFQPSEPGSSALVVILDVMGELSSVYGAADVAIMGGSFIEHGGQNPLEPAYWGKAIVCGPHMENFPFMEEFYKKGAALRAGKEDLFGTVKGLIDSPETSARMGRAAREFYERSAGATDRALEIIRRFI